MGVKQNWLLTIKKEPGKDPEHVLIENTLEALQKEVGGYIETVTIHRPEGRPLVLIVDEEGQLKGKAPNCAVVGISLVGTILMVGQNEDEFADCPISISMARRLISAYEGGTR